MKGQLIILISLACFLLSASEAKPSDKVCQPGSIFNVDCNECKCNKLGTDMACTRKFCPPTPGKTTETEHETKSEQNEKTEESKEAEVKLGERCIPGESFKVDCNTCTCPPSGLKSEGGCTLAACFHTDHKHGN